MGRRSAGTPGARRRWGARLCVLAGVACVLFAVVAPGAGATYGRLSADAGCDRVVEWTASASEDGTDAERSNSDVVVERREPGSGDDGWEPTGQGSFGPDDDFVFSGSFSLPDGSDRAELRVVPRADWGDGSPPGEPRVATASVPEVCAQQDLDLDLQEDCAAGGVRVDVVNMGSEPAAADVLVDRVEVRRLDVEPGGSAQLLVPLLDRRPTLVEVRNGDIELADRTFRSACDRSGPSAVVLERCDAHHLVVMANTDDATTRIVQTRLDGVIVNRSEMTSDRELQRTIELPGRPGQEASGSDIEIDIDGTVVATGSAGGCDGPVAGLVHCGGADRPDCAASAADTEVPAPPPPPESLNIEILDAELPMTGPWERGIVLALGGLLLVGGGLALLGRERGLPRPTPIADALAPYRQRWWDQH